MNRLKLLAVDDIESNLISLQYLIEEYCEDIDITSVSNGEDALKEAFTKEVDLILLDIQMPGMDGFDTAKFLKSNDKTKNIPIIFLTAAFKKEEFQQKGFEVGAIDYLTKPIEDLQFVNKLKLYKEVILKTKELEQTNAKLNESLKELEEKNRLLEKLSITDNLTQLNNRNKLDEVLVFESHRNNRYDTPFGVILIDIDKFKNVNDTFGHNMGDKVLQEFAKILKFNTRRTDTIGRWGGEEFLVICSETDLDGIKVLAENLRFKVANFSFPTRQIQTASFGIAVYKNGETLDSLINRADTALYNAKEKGRDTVEYL